MSLKSKVFVLVPIPRIKPEIVQLWTKTHCSQLDPYSDIEEMESKSSEKTETGLTKAEPSSLFFHMMGGHCLGPRKHTYHTIRNCRSSSKDKFYCDMCETVIKKKSKHSLKLGLSSPSERRVHAQQIIDLSNTFKKAGRPKRQQHSTYPVVNSKKPKDTATAVSQPEPDNDKTVPPTPVHNAGQKIQAFPETGPKLTIRKKGTCTTDHRFIKYFQKSWPT